MANTNEVDIEKKNTTQALCINQIENLKVPRNLFVSEESREKKNPSDKRVRRQFL